MTIKDRVFHYDRNLVVTKKMTMLEDDGGEEQEKC